MVTKKSKSSKKKASRSKTSSKSASTRKKSAKSKSTSRSRSSKKSTVRRSKSSAKSEKASKGLSLDRKLDITGIVLLFIGLLTLLSFISLQNSSLTGGWNKLLGEAFGVGRYLFPLGLMLIGGWLILRKFERIPSLVIERVLGFILLFLNILAVIHFIEQVFLKQDPFAIAQLGEGGGYTGAYMNHWLLIALGVGGTAIALAAWFLIALALALDVSVSQLFSWIPVLIGNIQDWITESLYQFQEYRRKSQSSKKQDEAGEFSPPPASQEDHASSKGESTAAQGDRHFSPQIIQQEWVLPDINEILDSGGAVEIDEDVELQRAHVIEETLKSFGAPARVVEINRGPTITQFGVEPDYIETRKGRMRVRVSKISALADDLALALSARRIRIQAPVPGKGYIGIEVPNEEISLVALRDILESPAFKRLKSPLRFALGQNVSGHAVAGDLAAMPHLLVAGATGSGKSVCVNALISCLLINNTPDELRMIMIDPKRVELTGYNGVPHLLAPVIVELERVVGALQWVTREMDMRYRKLADAGCRNLQDYNAKQMLEGGEKLPFLVVIIDELADLMMLAPDETEKTITRLAQLARATGIHLIISTQRPSVDVVTGLIKANFPARIAFAVASGVDSRVILDQPGAERLLGRGDMLFQAPDAPAATRLQGVFVSDEEIRRLVDYWRRFTGKVNSAPVATGGVVDAPPPGVPLKQMPMWEDMTPEENTDPLLDEAIALCRKQKRASISMLQRRLRIGYTRAARLIETMEDKGIIGPQGPGTGAREVLDYGQEAPVEDEN